MKLLTSNFLTCAVKTCKTSPQSYPLHFSDASLARTPVDYNPLFLTNVLPRLDWAALKTTASELGLAGLLPPDDELAAFSTALSPDDDGVQGQEQKGKVSEDVLRKLHELLLETGVVEGKLVCGNCGFEYPIKEGVGNFLLPAHLV